MTHAQFETGEAVLSSDWGEAKARAWFGDAAVDALPRYVRGPNAGKPKGVYVWTKVVRGGWVRCPELDGGGYVETRRGAIIERALYTLESGRYGRGAGTLLHRLDQDETLADVQARELRHALERLLGDLAAAEEKIETAERRLAKIDVKIAEDGDPLWTDIRAEQVARREAAERDRATAEAAIAALEAPEAVKAAERAELIRRRDDLADMPAEFDEDRRFYDRMIGAFAAA